MEFVEAHGVVADENLVDNDQSLMLVVVVVVGLDELVDVLLVVVVVGLDESKDSLVVVEIVDVDVVVDVFPVVENVDGEATLRDVPEDGLDSFELVDGNELEGILVGQTYSEYLAVKEVVVVDYYCRPMEQSMVGFLLAEFHA